MADVVRHFVGRGPTVDELAAWIDEAQAGAQKPVPARQLAAFVILQIVSGLEMAHAIGMRLVDLSPRLTAWGDGTPTATSPTPDLRITTVVELHCYPHAYLKIRRTRPPVSERNGWLHLHVPPVAPPTRSDEPEKLLAAPEVGPTPSLPIPAGATVGSLGGGCML